VAILGTGGQRRSYKEATAADVSDATQIAMASTLVPKGVQPVIIIDSGGHQSGRNDQRDGYQQLLSMLRAGLVAGFVVHDLSRLARNARMMLDLKAELDQRQVELWALSLESPYQAGVAGLMTRLRHRCRGASGLWPSERGENGQPLAPPVKFHEAR
jgi:hypothetical protein